MLPTGTVPGLQVRAVAAVILSPRESTAIGASRCLFPFRLAWQCHVPSRVEPPLQRDWSRRRSLHCRLKPPAIGECVGPRYKCHGVSRRRGERLRIDVSSGGGDKGLELRHSDFIAADVEGGKIHGASRLFGDQRSLSNASGSVALSLPMMKEPAGTSTKPGAGRQEASTRPREIPSIRRRCGLRGDRPSPAPARFHEGIRGAQHRRRWRR